MAEPFWQDRPDEWNTLVVIGPRKASAFFNTKVTPSGDISVKWDIKEVAKSDGAVEKYMGYSPAKPEVAWQLYTEEHWTDWQYLYDDIRPKPGKTGAVIVEVIHPWFTSAKLRKFWIDTITLPKQSGPDIFEVSLKLIEWFAQPKASKPQAKAGSSASISSVAVAGQPSAFIGPPRPPKPSAGLKP
jgi:hypothetical protein